MLQFNSAWINQRYFYYHIWINSDQHFDVFFDVLFTLFWNLSVCDKRYIRKLFKTRTKYKHDSLGTRFSCIQFIKPRLLNVSYFRNDIWERSIGAYVRLTWSMYDRDMEMETRGIKPDTDTWPGYCQDFMLWRGIETKSAPFETDTQMVVYSGMFSMRAYFYSDVG